jgi:hypothetical protein
MMVPFSLELSPDELPELPPPLSRLGAFVEDDAPEVTATRAEVVVTWEKVLSPLTVTMVVTSALVLLETGGAVMIEDGFFVVDGGSEDGGSEDESETVGVVDEDVGAAEDGGSVVVGVVEEGTTTSDERDLELDRAVVDEGVVSEVVSEDEEGVSDPEPDEDNEDDGDAPVPIGASWRLLFLTTFSIPLAETKEVMATRRSRRMEILDVESMVEMLMRTSYFASETLV